MNARICKYSTKAPGANNDKVMKINVTRKLTGDGNPFNESITVMVDSRVVLT